MTVPHDPSAGMVLARPFSGQPWSLHLELQKRRLESYPI